MIPPARQFAGDEIDQLIQRCRRQMNIFPERANLDVAI
ncbi:MAG: hypothetical protein OJF60_002702 [Burkholderiaceae bacterium]|nr:MAG: hypothetical protein OJF60_002702 [Burkholderiaceae bacterium]